MATFRQAAFFPTARVWVLSAICFVLPMKASFIYSLTAILLVLWLVEDGLKERIRQAWKSPVCKAFLAYYLIYYVAMLWTEDMANGWRMIGRQAPFLLFLVYWSTAQKESRERCVSAFLAGLAVCAVLAHYNYMQMNWFPEWPRGIRVNKGTLDTAPFIDWLNYAPILGIGCYFALHRLLEAADIRSKILHFLVAVLLLSNLSFCGGRAGMLVFAALLVALAFEKIRKKRRAIVFCILVLPTVFVLAYVASPMLAGRIDQGITDIKTFETSPNTSMGQRFVFWITTFKVFEKNPLIGVGSGDYPNEFAKMKATEANWSAIPDTRNPHNQYLMTLVTTGLLGLALLFFVFFRLYGNAGDPRLKALLIGYIVVCFVESYLYRSNMALTFSVLTAVLLARADIAPFRQLQKG